MDANEELANKLIQVELVDGNENDDPSGWAVSFNDEQGTCLFADIGDATELERQISETCAAKARKVIVTALTAAEQRGAEAMRAYAANKIRSLRKMKVPEAFRDVESSLHNQNDEQGWADLSKSSLQLAKSLAAAINAIDIQAALAHPAPPPTATDGGEK